MQLDPLNPASAGRKPRRRKPDDSIRRQTIAVRVTDAEYDAATALGDGNPGQGLRIALQRTMTPDPCPVESPVTSAEMFVKVLRVETMIVQQLHPIASPE